MRDTLREKMESAIESAYRNKKISINDIGNLLKIAREVYDLDCAYIVTNKEYRYQLRQVAFCDVNGIEIKNGKRILLIRSLYEQLVSRFKEDPFCEEDIPGVENVYDGNILRCALMQGEHYYGHISFCSKEARQWSDEEKETLSSLCYFMLVFLSIKFLEEGLKSYENENQIFQNKNISSGFFLNLESGKCHALKLASFLQEWVQEWEEYETLLNRYIGYYIDPMYGQQISQKCNLKALKEYLTPQNPVMAVDFPSVLNEKVSWYRCVIELIDCDEEGNPFRAYFYFNDITEQKNKELQLKLVSHNLKKEHKRALEAELQAMIDPLTGVYNRAGFERAVKEYGEENVPIGFVLIDIDRFKGINDTYGHEFGDEILQLVAKRLQDSFRNEDKVFRLGGDEFALLLYGCGPDAWRSLQMKFYNIHQYLKETVKKELSVTLSAGYCQSEHGYQEIQMTLSDEALYHTKSEGRAGLTQIDMEHQILNSWHDAEQGEADNTMPKAALIGNIRIEASDDSNQKPRLFLDEVSHMILGIPNNMMPEECFAFWKEHIAERNRELYYDVKEKLQTTGQAECTYHWIHPAKGEITLRTGNKFRRKGETKEIFGYIQQLKAADLVLSYDDSQFLMEALNRFYFCTYYFNLNSKDYYIVKGHENEPDVKEKHHHIDVTFREFVKNFVHPDYQQQVAEFADLHTLSDRLKDQVYIDCDYLSSTKMGWCRTRFMPVKWDADGNITHAMSMSACIDAAKRIEIQKEKQLEELLTTEQSLMSCVQHLIRIQDNAEAIDYILDQIVAYYDCNRANLSKLIGENKASIITERCNKGYNVKFYKGQILELTPFMKWDKVYSPINLHKVFCEGDESEEQRWMREEKIENLMILSFEYGDGESGFISIDGIRKHKDDSNWIGTLAFFVANAMEKKEK